MRQLVTTLVFFGCSAPTEIVVVVGNRDLVVPSDLDAVELRVTDPSAPADQRNRFEQRVVLCRPGLTSGCHNLPVSLTLVPGPHQPGDPIVVEADALAGSATVIADAARVFFSDGQQKRIEIDFSRDCLHTDCAQDEQSCTGPQQCTVGADGGVDLGLDLADLSTGDLSGIDLSGADFSPAPDLAPVERACGSVSFAAGGRNYLNAPAIPAYEVTSNFTLEAWINPSGFPLHDQLIAGRGGDTTGTGAVYGLWLNSNGHPIFIMSNGASVAVASSSTPVTLNTWTHVAGAYDGANHNLQLWVDGSPITTVAAPSPPLTGSGTAFTIGNVNGTPDFSYLGLIDEVRLSLGVRYSGNGQPEKRFADDGNTLALFHFDELGGTVAVDASPNANAATLVGGAVSFNSNCQYYRCNLLGLSGGNAAASPHPEHEPPGSFTLEAYIEPQDLTASGGTDPAVINVVDRAIWASNSLSYHLFIDHTGGDLPVFEISCDGNNWVTARSGVAISRFVWTHLAGVFDTSQLQLVLYQNGAKAAQTALGGACPNNKVFDTGTNVPFTIASGYHGFGPFKGWVSDVRLSFAVMYTSDFSSWVFALPSRLTPGPFTLVLYHLDDAPGSKLAADSSVNNHPASLSAIRADFDSRCF